MLGAVTLQRTTSVTAVVLGPAPAWNPGSLTLARMRSTRFTGPASQRSGLKKRAEKRAEKRGK